ncbi:unnamed protein product [Leuciscus chuanchicus]
MAVYAVNIRLTTSTLINKSLTLLHEARKLFSGVQKARLQCQRLHQNITHQSRGPQRDQCVVTPLQSQTSVSETPPEHHTSKPRSTARSVCRNTLTEPGFSVRDSTRTSHIKAEVHSEISVSLHPYRARLQCQRLHQNITHQSRGPQRDQCRYTLTEPDFSVRDSTRTSHIKAEVRSEISVSLHPYRARLQCQRLHQNITHQSRGPQRDQCVATPLQSQASVSETPPEHHTSKPRSAARSVYRYTLTEPDFSVRDSTRTSHIKAEVRSEISVSLHPYRARLQCQRLHQNITHQSRGPQRDQCIATPLQSQTSVSETPPEHQLKHTRGF